MEERLALVRADYSLSDALWDSPPVGRLDFWKVLSSPMVAIRAHQYQTACPHLKQDRKAFRSNRSPIVQNFLSLGVFAQCSNSGGLGFVQDNDQDFFPFIFDSWGCCLWT